MDNLLLIGNDPQKIEGYIADYCSQHSIMPSSKIDIFPEPNGLTIEQLRQVIVLTSRSFAQKTLFVIHSFETAKESVQNIFLKTLEEHQDSVGFILISSSYESIIATISSRCLLLDLSSMPTSLNDVERETITELLALSRKTMPFLVSSQLKLVPSKKKEQVVDFINLFVRYGYYELINTSIPLEPALTLSKQLKKALVAKRLIERNFLDPEIAADSIFFN